MEEPIHKHLNGFPQKDSCEKPAGAQSGKFVCRFICCRGQLPITWAVLSTVVKLAAEILYREAAKGDLQNGGYTEAPPFCILTTRLRCTI